MYCPSEENPKRAASITNRACQPYFTHYDIPQFKQNLERKQYRRLADITFQRETKKIVDVCTHTYGAILMPISVLITLLPKKSLLKFIARKFHLPI